MAIAHLNENNFDTETSQGTCLVDFWATWCGPCRMQAPVLEKLDAELQGSVKICKVDVDENPGLAQRFGVSSIPTLVVIRDGITLSSSRLCSRKQNKILCAAGVDKSGCLR